VADVGEKLRLELVRLTEHVVQRDQFATGLTKLCLTLTETLASSIRARPRSSSGGMAMALTTLLLYWWVHPARTWAGLRLRLGGLPLGGA